jgi:diguanylate cyclase (GGDEF)-like protein
MSSHQLTHPQLVEFLHQQIGRSDTKSIAVLIIDLRRTDRFEAITGNIPSQSIMQHVDQRLDALLRNTDRFAHFDGEQILLVLPNLANKDHSVLAAIKIISELKKSFAVATHSVTLRPHVGIANFPETGRDGNQLLMYADIALRIAATDEHGFYVYQVKDIIEPKAYNGLDIELENAIHANELRVNYQPKIDIQTGRCISAEALIRWTAPWGQQINPGLLVGTAENSGLINPLTLWILNTALRHAAAFSNARVDIGISVNLPPKMLEDKELPQIVQQALDIWGVPAAKLTLEITEGSMMGNIETSIAMLSKLKELGINLSIDDFGTGYSSLAYLKRLPVHELKIDILFVRNMLNSIGDKKLVRTIIDLAHNFDLTAVAEGVEDQQTFDLLRELGCDVAQGFLFSRALPEADFINWYRQRI